MMDVRDIYTERKDAEERFDRSELKRLRILLRRLRFLETKLRDSARGTAPQIGGGLVFIEAEIESLEFVLTEIEYLEINR